MISPKIVWINIFRPQMPRAVGIIAFVVLFFPGTGLALSSDQTNVFDRGIYYFNSDDSIASSCSSGDVPLSTDLPPSIITNINKSKPAYTQASQATGVPWQIIAAIHYREANNDPAQDLQAGNPFGGPYTRTSTDYKNGYPANLEQSAEIAAKHLIAASQDDLLKKPVNVPSPDPEGLKDAFFSYNGRATAYASQAQALGFNPQTQPYEGSPYVMNNFDAIHMNMKLIIQDGGPLTNVSDVRLGAFTFYFRLLGGTAGSSTNLPSSSCGSAAGGSIVQIAASQIGTAESPTGSNCGGSPQPDGHTVTSYTGGGCEEWCADFVSWVYNKAGTPFTGGASGGWRIRGVFNMRDWLKTNGIYTDRSGATSPPQPGDVMVFTGADNAGHVGIVETVTGTTVQTIEGNSGDKVQRNTYNYQTDPTVLGWGRMK